jgi:small subunit ribosomal protein S4
MKKKTNVKSAGKDLFQPAAPMNTSKKLTEYGRQLKEKQKVKQMYGVREKQFRRFFSIAKQTKGATGDKLISLLESRLDNVVFRLKLAKTVLSARKIIVHGHILVDGKSVYSPSMLVLPHSTISFTEKIKKSEGFMKNEVKVALARSIRVPEWLELDEEKYEGKVLRSPMISDVQASMNVNAIVELYSR